MDVYHSVWYHLDIELGSCILYEQKCVHLRQAFSKSSTWLPSVWGICCSQNILFRYMVLLHIRTYHNNLPLYHLRL